MLETLEGSGTKKEPSVPPPCFRCLFEKPIQDNWCEPETCEMLDHWLLDSEFSWMKYAAGWVLSLELKSYKANMSYAAE